MTITIRMLCPAWGPRDMPGWTFGDIMPPACHLTIGHAGPQQHEGFNDGPPFEWTDDMPGARAS